MKRWEPKSWVEPFPLPGRSTYSGLGRDSTLCYGVHKAVIELQNWNRVVAMCEYDYTYATDTWAWDVNYVARKHKAGEPVQLVFHPQIYRYTHDF